ncbi:hypothetical protein PTTG_12319 [Puccinia triticina 1-1 BBBD Race 1]|uniref:Uncharacterized protein n=2 Tax=Puccinia triticina TaxID=208348 RepID=A0A180GFE1_PUCT1|nr:uncharacterized protein PtA15_3A351 [Puccinia triticina]OAV91400.1 hypothetical protein PTTG_12319 [Puccinia triticina 1-1 BBBD Race 1]WAQ82985.1 hypothetical protein PtA15_3A351 [Puccinia triticina]
MNWNHLLPCLLMLLHVFHHQAIAMFGGFGVLSSKCKGLFGKFPGGSKSQDLKVDEWVTTAYDPNITPNFLRRLAIADEEPEYIAKVSERIVGPLIKLFENQSKNHHDVSQEMTKAIQEVMEEIQKLLPGKKRNDLAKIAIYARALGDITAANKPADYTITELEKRNRKCVIAYWDICIDPPSSSTSDKDPRVTRLFSALRQLWSEKRPKPSSASSSSIPVS